jgi:heme/copper-type cytochrome/quinol oxidase subunit 2
MELFNEMTLYMVCYPVLMFLVGDEEDSYDIGWLLIGLILVNIGINVVIMLFITGLKIREKYRKYLQRKVKIG